jgi:O-antigen ligase
MSNQTIYQQRTSKAFFWSLALFVITLPYSIRLNNIFLIVSAVAACANYLALGRPAIRSKKRLLLMTVLYFICLVGIVTSQNIKPALFDLEQKLPLLLVPIIFAFGSTIEKKPANLLLTIFIIATAGVCLHGFRDGFFWGYEGEELYGRLLVRHPYLGMYCVFCFFCCLELFRKSDKENKYRYAYLIGATFFTWYLVVLFAKMALVAFAILLYIYILWLLFENRKKTVFGGVLIATLLVIIYAALVNETGREITTNVLSFRNFEWDQYDPQIVNSVNLRFVHWGCSWEALKQDNNWLIGAGTGDAQEYINQCYVGRFGAESVFAIDNFNSHNQYLTTWLNLGIIPLLILVGHFLIILVIYFRERFLLGVIFVIGIMFFCLTESILEAHKGVTFYALIQSLFLFSDRKR